MEPISRLIDTSMRNNWANLNKTQQKNIFNVVAILPKAWKNLANKEILGKIPILDLVSYIYSDSQLKIKFPIVIINWLPAFTTPQLQQIMKVLADILKE